MHSFKEHYFLQEKLISDIRRALTTNIFKKRVVGIDLGRGKFKTVLPINEKVFNKILGFFRKSVVRTYEIKKQKNTRKLKNQLNRLFISDVFEGEIDSGHEFIKGTPISLLVYKISNNAQIAFITTEDENNNIRRFIATNSKGNDFFKEIFGITLQQIYVDSKAKEMLTKNTSYKEYDYKTKEDYETEKDYETEEDYGEKSEFGILDISKEDFKSIKKAWGDGKEASIKGEIYPFKDKFKREKYYSHLSGYSGYKYFDNKGHAVYLFDTGDNKNAFIAFKDRKSYDWAKKLGMLSLWRIRSRKISYPIVWRKGTIETHLE